MTPELKGSNDSWKPDHIPYISEFSLVCVGDVAEGDLLLKKQTPFPLRKLLITVHVIEPVLITLMQYNCMYCVSVNSSSPIGCFKCRSYFGHKKL